MEAEKIPLLTETRKVHETHNDTWNIKRKLKGKFISKCSETLGGFESH